MAAQIDPRARLAFGPFELNISTGELSKSGVRLRLSGQPMEILRILLAHAGEIVTREQLREHVWSEGTFVDFDGGLNAAMAKLRRALDDSAQHPRYIETIPGRGYRFLCRVESLNPISQTAPAAQPELEPASAPPQMRGRAINFWRWVEIAMVCALLTAAILRFYKAPPPPAWRLSPLTTSAALEDWPSLSPDGKLVVYSADPDFNGKVDLYLKNVAGAGSPIRLTFDGQGNRMPDFSPDGKRIVFRSNRNGGGIYQMPVFGGEVQLVAEGGLSPKFSPSGQEIAYWKGSETVAETVPGSGSVWIVQASGGASRRIAEPLTSARHPIWLPDGNSLLMVGYSSTTALDAAGLDWWIASARGQGLTRTGFYAELVGRKIKPSDTTANSRLRTPVPVMAPPGCWAAKQDAVITTVEGGENGNLWAVGISPATARVTGALTRLTTSTANEWNSSCSSVGAIAFTNLTLKRQLWTVPFDFQLAKSKGSPRPVVENASDRENPSLSQDGRYVAFVSNQSGRPNIWRRDLKTGTEIQVASSALVQRYPSISPSGLKIAYSVYSSNVRALYVADSSDAPKKLCDGCARATDWSHNEDLLLVFGGSPYQVDLLNLTTRKRTPLIKHTQYSVLYGRFSPDGRSISFTVRLRPDLAKIAIAPLNGSEPIPESAWTMVADVGLDDYANWSPDGRILYFSSPKDGNNCLWAQRMDNGRPLGEAFPVQHFHGRLTFGYGGWTAGPGQIAIALVDKTSNVWTMSQ
jgi:eukaryotic-like serine/threonine-protein kinase